jgi:hypothetical protein
MARQVPMEQRVLNTGVTAGEKMRLKRFERLLRDRYSLTMVFTEGTVKLSDSRKLRDGNILLKIRTIQNN